MTSQLRPVALVTGASRGIGAAIARELASRGFALVLAARSADRLAALADELVRSGTPALAVPVDLRQLRNVEQLAAKALAHYGRVDVLIHNAGIGSRRYGVARLTAAEIEELLFVNLHAPIHLTRTLLPQMLERNEGSVILIGSVAGQIAVPGSSIYSASKFGLRAFADSLRRETARSSIGVTLVAPGFIETDMTARLRGLPMGKPEDVARVVLRAIARPQREVFVPLYYAPLVWLARTWPGLVDAILSWRRR